MLKTGSSNLHFSHSLLPSLYFIHIHYAYFIGTCLLASIIFWTTSSPFQSVAYVDSLFMVISAMTETGLNTINLSQLTVIQQFILWFLMIIGSPIFVSISVILWRKRAFDQRFKSKQDGEGELGRISRKEKRIVGGIEYKAVRLLSYVVPAYFVLWQIVGMICLGAYISQQLSSIAKENEINSW